MPLFLFFHPIHTGHSSSLSLASNSLFDKGLLSFIISLTKKMAIKAEEQIYLSLP